MAIFELLIEVLLLFGDWGSSTKKTPKTPDGTTPVLTNTERNVTEATTKKAATWTERHFAKNFTPEKLKFVGTWTAVTVGATLAGMGIHKLVQDKKRSEDKQR